VVNNWPRSAGSIPSSDGITPNERVWDGRKEGTRRISGPTGRSSGKPAPAAITFGAIDEDDAVVVKFQQHPTAPIRGDLRNDPPPWNRFSTGSVENLNYP
jgi:hypothetical protein